MLRYGYELRLSSTSPFRFIQLALPFRELNAWSIELNARFPPLEKAFLELAEAFLQHTDALLSQRVRSRCWMLRGWS